MAADPQLLTRIDDYIEDLFVPADAALTGALDAVASAGLPPISVSPNLGKLLYLLAKITRARRVLEIGTLGGYSTIWLARALPAGGTVVSLELEATHAEVARKSIARAVKDVNVDVRVGPAADTLRAMIAAGDAPFDFVFIDADKPGYVAYLDLALPLAHSGTVIVADNLIRGGAVLDESPSDENARAIRAFNATLAAHPRLESIVVPNMREDVDGFSISLVK